MIDGQVTSFPPLQSYDTLEFQLTKLHVHVCMAKEKTLGFQEISVMEERCTVGRGGLL